ncbi:MAG: hypothetical protein ACK4ND_10450 [Cytophagaceae bacterium]
METTKGTFLLKEYNNIDLSSKKFSELDKAYKDYLKKDIFALPQKTVLETMLWAKREPISFGPYQNLTFFEISNRIYSDLVLLEAARHLFEEEKVKYISLCMSNHGGNDMTVTDKDGVEIIGEAFNTACSFFQIKMRAELAKFKDGKKGYIAFNTCALDESNKTFLEKKKEEYQNITFIPCEIP